ncbi:hypothetical protein ETH_00001485 [Eimeria tenella]|uniref:Translocation protein SEC62 n=1 Tax=Eimeria tenella TaxID=5802 RepID=U6L113_EIMTE|nr:hypothetical protein ETH_00001485 [Eimeria tenella]CDJ42289.1 hypothetical protein ETH_00001485 [Eimeria tenella]|eukprot:XP_013233039.1 hypothetical protein ETH_00001485 [Eimeria tenella]
METAATAAAAAAAAVASVCSSACAAAAVAREAAAPSAAANVEAETAAAAPAAARQRAAAAAAAAAAASMMDRWFPRRGGWEGGGESNKKCICMFPAWPLKLKIGVWYIAVVFLTILLFLIVLRLVLFLLLWFVGFDFWLLPNLFNEDAATLYHLSETHSPTDVAAFASQSFIDVLDWGRLRLEAPYLNTSNALPSAAAPQEENGEVQEEPNVLPDEEDYRCLAPCGYKSFEDLMASKCLVKCSCMQELVDSDCFKSCQDTTRAAIEEARGDACREEESRKARKQKNKK